MTTWLLLILAILAEVAATLSLKAALDAPVLYLVVAAGYAVTFWLLATVLRRGMGLGVAYGVWGAAGVTLTAILAAILFGEELNAVMGLGIVLVASGVMLVQLGSQRPRARASAEDRSRREAGLQPGASTDEAHAGARAGER